MAPRGLGLPGWVGKRFEPARDGSVTGVNLLRDEAGGGLREHLEMRASVAPSRLDGAPALAVTYAPDAPLPWRRIRDEFRALPDGTLLGMTVLDVRGLGGLGTPLVLEPAAEV